MAIKNCEYSLLSVVTSGESPANEFFDFKDNESRQ
jgi:hypothetical protein